MWISLIFSTNEPYKLEFRVCTLQRRYSCGRNQSIMNFKSGLSI